MKKFMSDMSDLIERADELASLLRGRTVTVCIPAKNEVRTIARVVSRVLASTAFERGVISEVLVVDDESTDGTSGAAIASGARVVSSREVLGNFGRSEGKGDAIWAALRSCDTEFCLFVDADITHISESFTVDLVEPLVGKSGVRLVKGSFKRITADGVANTGRLTALTTRPLLSVLNPVAARFKDPLSGLMCAETQTLRSLRLERDYGVDVGIFLDCGEKFGFESILEVDLGILSHQPRDLDELSISAAMICRAILSRHGGDVCIPKNRLPAVKSVSDSLPSRPNWSSLSPAWALNSGWVDGVGLV